MSEEQQDQSNVSTTDCKVPTRVLRMNWDPVAKQGIILN